jgi:putative ATPase
MKGVGYGKGYRYAHDDPAASEEMPCLSDHFVGRDYLGVGIPDEPGGSIGGSRSTATSTVPAQDDNPPSD